MTNTSSNHLECDEEQKETLAHGQTAEDTHATDDGLTLRTVVGNPNSAPSKEVRKEVEKKKKNRHKTSQCDPCWWSYS